MSNLSSRLDALEKQIEPTVINVFYVSPGEIIPESRKPDEVYIISSIPRPATGENSEAGLEIGSLDCV